MALFSLTVQERETQSPRDTNLPAQERPLSLRSRVGVCFSVVWIHQPSTTSRSSLHALHLSLLWMRSYFEKESPQIGGSNHSNHKRESPSPPLLKWLLFRCQSHGDQRGSFPTKQIPLLGGGSYKCHKCSTLGLHSNYRCSLLRTLPVTCRMKI